MLRTPVVLSRASSLRTQLALITVRLRSHYLSLRHCYSTNTQSSNTSCSYVMSDHSRSGTSTPLNPTALLGFSGASSYDSYRPSYNPIAFSHLLSQLNLAGRKNARILEIAAGTGKFTKLLSEREEEFVILATEPHGDMIKVLREKELRGVYVREGTAYEIPCEEGWAEGIVAAQAFHWFADTTSLHSFLSPLIPGGSLGFIWNVEDYNQTRTFSTATDWEGKLRDLNWEYTRDSVPRYKDEKWREVFDSDVAKEKWGPLGERLVREKVYLNEEGLWRRLGTLSNIANLSEGEKTEMKAKFDEIIRNATDAVRNEKGELEVHSTCHVAWTRKK
ncbi:putative 2-heptaprenyl-1,4-naphthoquinone methyltransferase [Pyronema domesticum]|nr:putative 2-heptaprenyl-1,4-naphthoquinone methyltransferase [Pyronema domesticum]